MGVTEPEEAEIVDGLPVLSEEAAAPAAPAAGGELAVVGTHKVAALAAGGFVAGAATMALAHRRKASKLLAARGRKRLPFGEVIGSNSFLVDVHLLRRD